MMENNTIHSAETEPDHSLNGGFMSQYIPLLYKYDASLKHKIYVWNGSLLFDIALFFLVYLYSQRLKTFKALPNKHKVFWCLTGVRAIFGIHTVIFCGLTALKDSELYNDKVFGRTLSSDFFIARIVGFFIFECMFLFMSDIVFKTLNKGLAIHHTLSLLGFAVGSYINQGHFFGIVGIIMEMSTPATSICWMLIQAKLSKHYFWKINQHILIYLFNTRQNLGFYAIYHIWAQWSYIHANMNGYFQWLILANSLIVTLILNPYWTYKKTVQLYSGEDWNFTPLAKPKASAFPIIATGKEDMSEELETFKSGDSYEVTKISKGVNTNGIIRGVVPNEAVRNRMK
ncbi:Protein CLN8-like [Oopsacas minuta]|uniref:Protein CLN8-like n=1 Tax=Oopsacas minuta TaxID=111878 RepID=A0AAV7JEN5_9METZ|nr:Protein CLN8-like [Oopsacas minuta]